jgi:hypothetical protein
LVGWLSEKLRISIAAELQAPPVKVSPIGKRIAERASRDKSGGEHPRANSLTTTQIAAKLLGR